VIAVDTSALMAILLQEPEADSCAVALANSAEVMISATTLAEALIVAGGRGLADRMDELLGDSGFTVVNVTPASARRTAEAYSRWGKGIHPARLNLGDCFAYELAKSNGCPLLYVGEDFARTDVLSAL